MKTILRMCELLTMGGQKPVTCSRTRSDSLKVNNFDFQQISTKQVLQDSQQI